jgi:hypothetical protein
VPCDTCGGRRYNRETLEIRYRGRNIHEVLEMTVEDASPFFRNIPAVHPKLQTLIDVQQFSDCGASFPTCAQVQCRVEAQSKCCSRQQVRRWLTSTTSRVEPHREFLMRSFQTRSLVQKKALTTHSLVTLA